MSSGEARKDEAAAIAERQGFSEAAGHEMAAALRRGGGRQAQFNHPELGGMGQWAAGGMVMIGDMNDTRLKARVAALAADIAHAMETEKGAAPAQGDATDSSRRESDAGSGGGGRWWPADLGSPSSSGAQNDRLYAVFPDKQRLAVKSGGRVRVFDTGDHRVSGAGQQQGGGGGDDLTFSSQRGNVRLADLTEVDAAASSDSSSSKGASPWAR